MTNIIFASLRFSRAPCVAGARARLTIFGSRSLVHSAEGYRMSSRCRYAEIHHRELHRQGDERSWWDRANINPMSIALRFWQQTQGVTLPASSNQKPKIQGLTNGSSSEGPGAANAAKYLPVP